MIDTILTDIAEKHGLRKSGSRYAGKCPKCGGSEQSDRFQIRDDGGFKCFACDWKGDIITWLREMDGKSCPGAHDAAGLTCRATGCPVAGTCRLGNGSGVSPAAGRKSVEPPPVVAGKRLPVRQVASPDELWREWAGYFLAACRVRLQGKKAELTWLASRGIDAAAVERFNLGWNGGNGHVQRSAIGLTPVKDGKTEMWLPVGLVIPIMADGAVHRIRIRRPSWSRESFLPDLKYVWMEGSGNAPMVLQPSGPLRGAVIVEAELDAMAVAAAHGDVLVVALGTVNGPLPVEMVQALEKSPVILVALDADSGEKGSRAGQKATATWLSQYRQARYWPVPAGKDVGDYVRAGGSVAAWVEAGLPPVVGTAAGHEAMQSPGCLPVGGAGKEIIECQDGAGVVVVELVDGRLVHVVEARGEQESQRAAWRRLVAAGQVVFSENEFLRLRAACVAAGGAAGEKLAMDAVAVKEVFAGAYVRKGGAV